MKGEAWNPLIRVCWLRDDSDCLPGLATPETQGSISTLGGQESPVHREGDSIHALSVPFEGAKQLAAGHFPQLHRIVQAPTGQRPARRIEGDAKDRAIVPFEGAEQLAAGHLPQLHRIVTTPAGERPARRVERNAPDNVLMPLKRA